MKKRHVIFGAVFVAIFGIGMLNVMSDGRLGHAIQSQFPWHIGSAEAPSIEVENLSVEQGEIGEVEAVVRNTDMVSYANYELSEGQRRLDLDAKPYPGPSFVKQSLPPYWNYDHVEKKVVVNMEFNISENTDPGVYDYGIEAWNGDYPEQKPVMRNFTVQVLGSSED